MPKQEDITPESPKSPVISEVIPDPQDEFPIGADIYCRIKHLGILNTKIFQKVMSVEARYKKFFIKEWDQKYQEFFGRTV
jgi:hypothetical protein